ncbi:MAG: hypothetical protein WAL71_07380 [Terriglobales bacterium]
METIRRSLIQTILIVAVAVGCVLAQSVPEKHVKDIQAEQPQDVIYASPLCQQAKAARLPAPQYYGRLREVNPATLEKDLPTLMQKSDEVVLAGRPNGGAMAVSPSGEDAIWYRDVRVLHTWKGSHKVGDILTFAFPTGTVRCGPGEHDIARTLTGRGDKLFAGSYMQEGPSVLFLRHGDTGLIGGLRLTGGDGTQGMFVVKPSKPTDAFDEHNALNACFRAGYACNDPRYDSPECRDPHIEDEMIAKCNAALNVSQKAVTIGYGRDLLLDKYDGMPISKFLKKVQAVADSLGYAGQAGDAAK